MRNIILFDDDNRARFLPLTFTRPFGEIRMGILTIKEKWEKWLEGSVSYITQEYLTEKYPIHIAEDNFIINSAALPNVQLCSIIRQLNENEAILKDGELIATRLNERQIEKLINDEEIKELEGYDLGDATFTKLEQLTDLFKLNEAAIRSDFDLITNGRTSAALNESNWVKGVDNIFVEAGAEVDCSVLNAEAGPIYIGKNVKILEGCMLRGPISFGNDTLLKMGAKVYGATTFGPGTKAGGEIKNSIFFGNSNKGHDGYLGNSIIGEWCNMGADTNTSNMKNNYANVKQWNYAVSDFVSTEEQFCGLVMGDHSKCGINTMFNTGTVVGVSANIFGGGFPPKFIPSFAWGGSDGLTTFQVDKAFEVAERMMQRRGIEFDVNERLMMMKIYEDTKVYRTWEDGKNQ